MMSPATGNGVNAEAAANIDNGPSGLTPAAQQAVARHLPRRMAAMSVTSYGERQDEVSGRAPPAEPGLLLLLLTMMLCCC